MILQRALSALFSMISNSIPVVPGVLGTQARIVRQFYDAGALNPYTARRFYPRSSSEATAFASLLAQLIICQSAPGHYFLDLDAINRRSTAFLDWRQ